MAKKEKEKFDYAAELRALKLSGPERLYLLCGREDYLRERFLDELKKLCVGDAPAEFNHRRMNGNPEPQELFDAVESAPFCSEHTLVEARDFDINACRDAQLEQLKEIWADIPDYCTLVLLTPAGNEPDGRLASVKAVKKLGKLICFEEQEKNALVGWIARRFAALGKKISRSDAEQLIFSAGGLMNQLIPEIDKLSAGVKGDTVTARDIDELVQPLPEARVFNFTDQLAARDFDAAAQTLAELILCREKPVKLFALIASQFRKLYAVALAREKGAGNAELMELAGTRFGFVLDKLRAGARRFTLPQLRDMIELCAVYDYRLKSSGTDENELLRELFAAMAARVQC